MAAEVGFESALSPEGRAAVWRIFGVGAAPGTRLSTYEQIDPVIREHVPAADQNRTIAHIGSWFEPRAHVRWLKPELSGMVAELVLEGVGPRRSEAAIWAIGSIGPELSVEMIRGRWSAGEIDSFLEATIQVLNGVSARAARSDRPERDGSAEGSFRDVVRRDGLVEAFARLESHSGELVNQGLHPTVGILIELAVELDPKRFGLLVERLEEPAMQAKAARRMFVRTTSAEAAAPASWIASSSCAAVVALAIVHTLNSLRRIEEGRALLNAGKADEQAPSVRRVGDKDGLDSASSQLLSGLVEGLARLDPPTCMQWIGELLSHAPRALLASGAARKPIQLVQLEEGCTRLAARLFFECWSADLLVRFQSGLRPSRRRSWIHHQAAVAWTMREFSPERAADLAQATLDEHGRQLAEQPEGQYLWSEWSDWTDRDWLEGLGTVLALSLEERDLPAWVTTRCRDLPLSVWDAEEDLDAFWAAEQTAQHWFLVALLAIPRRSALGQRVPPSAVLALAEALWSHCRFCRQILDTHPDASVVSELAARYSMEFGQADDRWILGQVQKEGVGPRVLWALLEERRARSRPPIEGNPEYDQMIVAELVRVASIRFEDGGQYDLETLEFWARLWLSLGAVDQAERTATAILSFPLRAADREYRILALKLLGLVSRKRKLPPGIREHVEPLYHQLWPTYDAMSNEDTADRREIDHAFTGSNLLGR